MKKITKWGVIPFRYNSVGSLEFLLVSTLRGNWVFPKGNLIKRLGPGRTAKLEAYEEAGVSGKISVQAFRCKVNSRKFFFYMLEVSQVFNDWPESNFRARKWVSPEKANKLLHKNPYRELLELAINELHSTPAKP